MIAFLAMAAAATASPIAAKQVWGDCLINRAAKLAPISSSEPATSIAALAMAGCPQEEEDLLKSLYAWQLSNGSSASEAHTRANAMLSKLKELAAAQIAERILLVRSR